MIKTLKVYRYNYHMTQQSPCWTCTLLLLLLLSHFSRV